MPKKQKERRRGVLPGTLRDKLNALVREHFEIEQGLKEVAVYSRGDHQEFLLVEVNDEALPTGTVDAFYFAPSDQFSKPLHVADVTSDEWNRIRAGVIPLPAGWPETPVLIIKKQDVLE